MNLDLFEAAETMIKRHEGLKLKPYLCPAGKLTIGYGRNMEDVGISEEEAVGLLHADITTAASELEREFGPGWYNGVTLPRAAALIDMMFNLGATRFGAFKEMIAAVRNQKWDKAADAAQDSKWFTQVGDRGKTIVRMLREG